MILAAHAKRIFFCRLVAVLFLLLLTPYRLVAEEVIARGEKLSLDKCIDIAAKGHPQILSAQYNLEVFKSRIGQAKAGYFPQINWSADASRNASAFRPDLFNLYSHNLSLNQNLYDFNRVAGRVDIQTLALEAARANLENIAINVILGAKLAYYQVLRATKAREISRETVKLFEERLETAKGFYEAGAKAVFDVTQAEVDLGNARVNLVRADNAVIIAFVNLNNAMGMPGAPPYELGDDVSYRKGAVDLDESLAKAFLNRTDLQSLLIQKETAQKLIQLARKDYLPSLTGSANYGWSGEQFPLERGWNVGALLSFNLFSGYLTKNQVGEAVAGLEVTRAGEQVLRQTIRLEVEQAVANLRAAEKSYDAAEITVRQALENYELAQGRYAAGVGVSLELSDAVVALGNAKLTLSGAIYDREEAAASLKRAMGEK